MDMDRNSRGVAGSCRWIIFTCVEPILRHEYDTAFWTIIGPVFFGVIAWLFYHQAVAKGKLDK